MDMAFLRRAERMLDEHRAAPLDHMVLLAALAAQHSARAMMAPPEPAAPSLPESEALSEILLAGPGWRKAVRAQRGSFSRAEAGRRINGL